MRNTLTIAWKETRTYVASPMAYVVSVVFLALTGYFFVDSISTPLAEATVRGYIDNATLVLVLLAPLLTMRLMAEEQKLGTIELLLTTPVRDWEVATGKFLASVLFFAATLALTLFYALLLFWAGDPDTGPILSGYLGLLLYGAAALAVGLFTSSLTSNQIVAAVVAFGVLLLLNVVHLASGHIGGVAGTVLEAISMTSHFQDFARGLIDLHGVVYYLSLAAVFLFLTVRSLETRRWR